jgi:nucleoid DNA-binding protein
VTKKEIVKAISEEIGLTQLKTKEIVQKTFDAIVETLVADKRIELRNFGVFEVKKRAARKARNPRTGERVDVAEKYVVTFKPGKEMEERVRQLEQEAAQRHAAALETPATPTAPELSATGGLPAGESSVSDPGPMSSSLNPPTFPPQQ